MLKRWLVMCCSLVFCEFKCACYLHQEVLLSHKFVGSLVQSACCGFSDLHLWSIMVILTLNFE